MADEILIAPATLCGSTDVQLAHETMRGHRACRVERCVWKAAAHHTLVLAGRLVPPLRSPRERAAARGVDFPTLDTDISHTDLGPALETMREVLNKLIEPDSPVARTDRTHGAAASGDGGVGRQG
ncbi:hypothetical protein [Nocardia amamiensis]|uniref:hypothetical protein n=1 Tax=Nocardia amamiensis TaxID=404578 RepID=UPI00082C8191|nr:hypothetical protein [Nocardia amamiensis]